MRSLGKPLDATQNYFLPPLELVCEHFDSHIRTGSVQAFRVSTTHTCARQARLHVGKLSFIGLT